MDRNAHLTRTSRDVSREKECIVSPRSRSLGLMGEEVALQYPRPGARQEVQLSRSRLCKAARAERWFLFFARRARVLGWAHQRRG